MAVCVPFATPGLLFGKRTQEVTGRWPPPLSRRHSGAARPVSREMALPGRRGTTAAAPGSALPPPLRRNGGPVRGDGERLARGSREATAGASGALFGEKSRRSRRGTRGTERGPCAAALREPEAVPQRHRPGGAGQRRAGPAATAARHRRSFSEALLF
ncbi:unnamed protein product [Coccothraustes coccothraustes]